MFCSKCGADNPAAALFCAKCGTTLASAAAPPPQPPTETVRSAAALPAADKTPWLGALLSFFIVGLGQLYNSDFKKAAVMFGGFVLGLWLTAGVVSIGIWVWAMIDGWQVAAGKFKRW